MTPEQWQRAELRVHINGATEHFKEWIPLLAKRHGPIATDDLAVVAAGVHVLLRALREFLPLLETLSPAAASEVSSPTSDAPSATDAS